MNRKLFDVTGYKFINSFISSETEGDLIVASETLRDIIDPLAEITNGRTVKISCYNLQEDKFYTDWLEENKGIIPERYGGLAKPCDCQTSNSWENHKRGCHWNNFNQRAVNWLVKPVSLNYALQQYSKVYPYVVWLDCDIILKQRIPEKFIHNIFKDCGCFYHLGPNRKSRDTGIESGVCGFSQKNRGFDLLRKFIDVYNNKQFHRYSRWDDGYLFRKIVEGNPDIPTKDLVGPHREQEFAHVVKHGIFAPYIDHDKGSHHRKYKVV